MIILIGICIIAFILNPIIGIAIIALIGNMALFVWCPILGVAVSLGILWFIFGIDIQRSMGWIETSDKKNNKDDK